MRNPFRKLIQSIAKDAAVGIADFAISKKAEMLRSELQRRATVEAVDFVDAHMQDAMFFADRLTHLGFALQKRPAGLVLEFGVYKGPSINFIARRLDYEPVYGFDSFSGLPEHWAGNRYSKQNFDRGGRPPRVRKNVQLVVGWFNETLPKFLESRNDQVGFVHLDADIYSSTKYVLDTLLERLASGAVIAFDEFFNYHGYKLHEYKAFFDFVEENRLAYKFIGYSGAQVSVEITKSD